MSTKKFREYIAKQDAEARLKRDEDDAHSRKKSKKRERRRERERESEDEERVPQKSAVQTMTLTRLTCSYLTDFSTS